MSNRKRRQRRVAPGRRRTAKSLPSLAGGVARNKAVGLAAERQYQFVETLKGSQVTRTGRGSDFKVQGLLAAAPHFVEVKTGNAVLSALQRSTGPEVVRPNPFLNSAIAAGIGVAGGVVSAAAITRLAKEHLELTCGACGNKNTADRHFCSNCGAPLPRGPEMWIGLGLLGLGGLILVFDLLTLGLNLPLDLLAGALLGAGIYLLADALWANFRQPSPVAGAG
jgi:hypothetical protein